MCANHKMIVETSDTNANNIYVNKHIIDNMYGSIKDLTPAKQLIILSHIKQLLAKSTVKTLEEQIANAEFMPGHSLALEIRTDQNYLRDMLIAKTDVQSYFREYFWALDINGLIGSRIRVYVDSPTSSGAQLLIGVSCIPKRHIPNMFI